MTDDRHQSFWTTLPGVLTGLAALVTAVVGLIALFVGRQDEPGTGAPAASSGTASSSSAPASGPGAQGAQASSVDLQLGDALDVDTGMVGTAVDGELVWAPGQLDLYGRRNAIVKEQTDEAGCRSALDHRSDAYVNGDQLRRLTVVCLSTDEGAVAEVRVNPPDVTDRLTLDLTVWPG